MHKLGRNFEKFFTKISTHYIDFVYKSSKIEKRGEFDLLQMGNDEKFIIGFWHGESYCFFPALKGSKLYVLTTRNRRGDYIADTCRYFGYSPLRVPDESLGGNFLFKIRRQINGTEGGNLAIALDGPLGPYHRPKDFAFLTALISKRRLLPVSVKVKKRIQLTKRWDKYMIPLPFNKIEIYFHEPMKINKKEIGLLKEKVVDIMENELLP